MTLAGAHGNGAVLLGKGIAAHDSGRLEEAEDFYRRVLAVSPDRADVRHRLGVLLHERGRTDEALAEFERIDGRFARDADFYSNFGLILYAAGRVSDAHTRLREALALAPAHAGALRNLALILEDDGDRPAAIELLRKLVAAVPGSAVAHFLLGRNLARTGEDTEAERHLREALRLEPDFADARLLLAERLRDSGRQDEAEDIVRPLAEGVPPVLDAAVFLARVRERRGDAAGRDSWLARARAADPAAAERYYAKGMASFSDGAAVDADEAWRVAEALDPRHGPAAWAQRLLLPVIYRSSEEIESARAGLEAGLGELERRFGPDSGTDAHSAFRAAAPWTNFCLAYQGRDDRDLQARYGRLVSGIVARRFPAWAAPPPMPEIEDGDRLRVGFFSAHLHRHSVTRLFAGWLENLDRRRFRVFAYHAGVGSDSTTDLIRRHCDVFRDIGKGLGGTIDKFPAEFEALCRLVRQDRLHALIHLDVGMHAAGFMFAAARLAPIQAACLGHPVTTGLPTVDYFLSGALVESARAAAHYSETLVRLPNTSFRLFAPGPAGGGHRRAREFFGVAPGDTMFLATQSAFKYLPQHDRIFVAVARAVPSARFVFIRSPNPYWDRILIERLKHAFGRAGLDWNRHCRFQDRLAPDDYGALNEVADVFLDSIGWSGGNTTHEAIAAGLPVVTLDGEFARGRVSAGMLRMIGVEETVARDEDDYIALAVRLGQDEEFRRKIRAATEASRHKLYNDEACVRGLEDFLVRAVAERTKKP